MGSARTLKRRRQRLAAKTRPYRRGVPLALWMHDMLQAHLEMFKGHMEMAHGGYASYQRGSTVHVRVPERFKVKDH